jgi:sporulation protein YhbH
MAVVRDSVLPADRGARDARHHHERVRKQIGEWLRTRIGEEDIVTAGPEKRLRVPVKGEKRYRFIFDRGLGGVGQGEGEVGAASGPVGPGDAAAAGTEPGEVLYEVEVGLDEVEELLFAELGLPRLKPRRALDVAATDITFDDIARTGPLLDKKATLRENLLRNAKRGDLRLGDLEKDDLRYRSYRQAPRPRTQAVVICMMDVSGSMGEVEKRISRLFYYWTVRFLRRQYTLVEVVFVGHTSEAFELSEQEFFTRKESGGTVVSSAYRLAQQIQRQRFPEAAWNVYVLHTSDGDNLGADNPATLALIEEHLRVANLVGYLEIATGRASWGAQAKLSGVLTAAGLDGLVVAATPDDRGIWPALKQIFAREGVEEAVVG